VIESRGFPCGGAVAVVAFSGSEYVIRVLAGGYSAVVAGGTASEHLSVVHPRDRLPCNGCMAGLAARTRLDMRSALACGTDSVMAARASRGDPGVIEASGSPRDRRVARTALGRRRDVARSLAGRGTPVVARRTGTQDLHVIHDQNGRPSGR
jgi:hypothetical protein